jgi:hypothetical protein
VSNKTPYNKFNTINRTKQEKNAIFYNAKIIVEAEWRELSQ